MIARRSAGVPTFMFALVAGTLLMAIGMVVGGSPQVCIPAGLALPSPCQWIWSGEWSALAAWGLAGVSAVGAMLLNKHFDFITGTDMVLPSVFFLLMASNPEISSHTDTALLLAPAAIIMLALAMGSYRTGNSTQHIFIAASIASAGAMIDIAFIIPALWCLPAWGIMKSLRFREIIAYAMGLIAPWWCVLGTGLISVDALNITPLIRCLQATPVSTDTVTQTGLICWWAFVGLLVGLNTAVKLYAGNSRVRALNNIITLLGLMSVLGMAIDFEGMRSYIAVFYFALAAQLAQVFALWHIPKGRLWLTVIFSLIILQFPLILLI